MTEKKPIPQEDMHGCGVACTAFVAGKTYHEIRKFFDDKKILHEGVYSLDIVKVLENFGLSYDYAKVSDINYELTMLDGTIVFLPRSEADPVGHWLVRYNGRYMDPWTNRNERYNLNVQAKFIDEIPARPSWVVFPARGKDDRK
jgi:hypothetical protein